MLGHLTHPVPSPHTSILAIVAALHACARAGPEGAFKKQLFACCSALLKTWPILVAIWQWQTATA